MKRVAQDTALERRQAAGTLANGRIRAVRRRAVAAPSGRLNAMGAKSRGRPPSEQSLQRDGRDYLLSRRRALVSRDGCERGDVAPAPIAAGQAPRPAVVASSIDLGPSVKAPTLSAE